MKSLLATGRVCVLPRRLFWSGAFWNILSFSLIALFLFNLIAPALLEDWLRKQVRKNNDSW